MAESISDALVSHRTLQHIERHRGNLLLHAGGASATDGRTIIVHGESGAGKTSLTLALTELGLAYVSDETICIDPHTLEITPFQKPLTIKPGAQPIWKPYAPPRSQLDPGSGNWQLPWTNLRGPTLPSRLIPAYVVFPRYDSGAHSVQIETVGPAQAAFRLGENSSALAAIQRRPLGVLAKLVTTVPTLTVTYRDAREAAPLISELLHDRSKPPKFEYTEHLTTGYAGSNPQPKPGIEWVEIDHHALIFDGTHMHLLDQPGLAVWKALDGSRTHADVVAHLSTQFEGNNASLATDVEDLIRVLRQLDLIVG